MTRIKICGLRRPEDIRAVNGLQPEFIGFVFFPGSKRYVEPEEARDLKAGLAPGIKAVGVFVNEKPETVASLLNDNVIDLAQLHGEEDEDYIAQLRRRTGKPLIKAFRVRTAEDLLPAGRCSADHILLDAGAGTGTVFDWDLIRDLQRPYFLAGGLSPGNAADAVTALRPFAVDVSSGIETGGKKDKTKMAAFLAAVRKADRL